MIDLNFGYFFLATAASYFLSGLILATRPLLRVAFSNLIFVVAASLSALLVVNIDLQVQRELTLALLVVSAGIVMTFAKQWKVPKLLISLFMQSFAVFALVAVFEALVRYLKVAGIAFGDIFTIISITDGFRRGADLESLSLSIALKRGVGIPSLQSLAPTFELSHGFMVFVFLGWLLASLHLFRVVFKERAQKFLWPSYAAFLVISISTEAVLRNVLFMSSHVLVANALLLMTIIYLSRDSSFASIAVITICASGSVFLRADNALIMLFPLALVLFTNFAVKPKYKAASLLVTYLSLPIWLIGFSVDISIVIIVAATIFALALATLAYILPVKVQDSFTHYLITRAPWLLLLGIVASLATSVSLSSFEALYQNYVQGQGLWGYTILVLIPLAMFFYFRGRIVSGESSKLFGMAFGILGMLVWAKFGDSFLNTSGVQSAFASGNPLGFARIGWGDSINRLLIYVYTPIAAYVFSKLMSGTQKEKTSVGK